VIYNSIFQTSIFGPQHFPPEMGQIRDELWTWIVLDPDYSEFCWIWIGSGL